MKKFALFCGALVLSVALSAQERVIKMPEAPTKVFNVAEADRGTFWCFAEVGGGSTLMEGMKNVAMVGASFACGYRFNQYAKVGAGLGVLYYPNSSNVRDTKKHLAMPLFLNVHGNILSEEIRRTVPYWSLNIGGSIPDGFFLTPSVGLRIGEKRNAFLISIGYTLRHLKSYPECVSYYSGALLKFGYEF